MVAFPQLISITKTKQFQTDFFTYNSCLFTTATIRANNLFFTALAHSNYFFLPDLFFHNKPLSYHLTRKRGLDREGNHPGQMEF